MYEASSLEGSAKGPLKMSRVSPCARLKRLNLSLMGPYPGSITHSQWVYGLQKMTTTHRCLKSSEAVIAPTAMLLAHVARILTQGALQAYMSLTAMVKVVLLSGDGRSLPPPPDAMSTFY